ncbi:hypothetical protein Zm00014a_009716 [Zea mays]|uniref:Guanylate-binding protein/Atlastin C-terminal domain-containing protein n=1 Tax=Zea mays TaxID=4577 RepID=A0A3L6EB79_MAIZE|nr:hypothetical protein Zm00014a_009716 [Zea mays]
MGRKWNELLSSAPWRTGEAAEDEDAARMSREGKVSVTSNPEEMPTMSVPRSRRPDLDLTIDDFEEDKIDPKLRYSLQRNTRVPALNVFAVGAGSARSKFEKLLHSSLKKAFEDYKRNAFLEADLQCSNKVQNMESKVRATCNSSNAKLDDIVRLLDDLLTEYESTAYGPGKWKRLATFLQQCLAGPVLELFRRQLEHIDA